MRRVGVTLVAGVLLAGCGGGSEKPHKPGRAAGPAPPAKAQSSSERVVRGWIAALNKRRYGKAADYFARGAVVQQTVPIKLTTRRAAIAFNRSLPCTAKVTDVKDEGKSVLATFRLFDGPGGRCEPRDGSIASARVRCVISRGRFLAWHQLPESRSPEPGGRSV